MRNRKILRQAIEALETRRLLAGMTFTVTDATDGSATSLRAAITASNANNPGAGNFNTIDFNIDSSGALESINLLSALPAITQPVVIDGYSEPDASANTLGNADNAVILIELNGAGAGAGVDGLTLGAGSGGSTIRGLDIVGFTGNGVVVQSNASAIFGNFIGVGSDGSTRDPNGTFPTAGNGVLVQSSAGNFIGGTSPADRNILSGNALDGVKIAGTLAAPASQNVVEGNFIGVAADGISSVGIRTETAPAPGTAEGNNLFGVEISGGVNNFIGVSGSGSGNVIGFNLTGITIDNGGQGNEIRANFIGVGADGVTPAGNLQHGVDVHSSDSLGAPLGPGQPNEPGTSNNHIGAVIPGYGNVIEFNGQAGVAVFGNPISVSAQANTGNTIEGNSIFENGRDYLTAPSSPAPLVGIDLTNGFVYPRDDGATANDSKGHGASNDPNNFQNSPVLSFASSGAVATVSGTLHADANKSYEVEFFSNGADPLGLPAEGQNFVGSTLVTTDVNGDASFSATLPGKFNTGEIVTATATDPDGNTSEFSAPIAAALPNFVVTNTQDTGAGSLQQAIADANGTVDATIQFDIPGAGVHTISPSSAYVITEPVTIDGYTQPGSSPNTLATGDNAVLNVEVSGANLPAGFTVIDLDPGSDGSVIRGLVINTTTGLGSAIDLESGGSTISGNFIGTDPTGTSAKPLGGAGIADLGPNNVIGGVTPADRNLISGSENGGIIIEIPSGGATVQGNYIGTDASGTIALPNVFGIECRSGVGTIIGGTAPGSGNLISGNRFQGIFVLGDNQPAVTQAYIEGNLIGTDATGTSPLGNGAQGVVVTDEFSSNSQAVGSIIGGSTAAAGNTIAFNGGAGVVVSETVAGHVVDNAIRHNSIHDNAGLGIDLSVATNTSGTDGDGPTFNDPGDTDSVGGNDLQNFPVLASAQSNATNTTVQGQLNSSANGAYLIDFYSTPKQDNQGFGQGETYLGTITVNTDSLGHATFSATLPVVQAGQFITATATTADQAPAGDTSEFSPVVDVSSVVPPPPPTPILPTLSINDVTHDEKDSGTHTFTFTVTRSGDTSGTSDVYYSTSNGTATAGSDYTAIPLTQLHFAAKQTTATIVVTEKGDTTYESDETFFVNLSNPTNATITVGKGVGMIVNDDAAPAPSAKVSIVTDPCDSTKTAVEIDDTDASDTITVTKSGSSQGKVVVKINGSNKGTFSFTGSIIVHGKGGNDNISIDSAITRESFLFGEAGNDTISGGGGADVIVGGDGNDKLSGNSGRDILIGSDGSDSLSGGNDDDILDGGTTNYDTDISSLCKLQDEWTRTDKNYSQRVNDIRNGGGLNGSVKLNASTTFSSTTLKDTLTGGAGSDLFFVAMSGDKITDKASGETAVTIG